jgi:hypothetical protein
MQLTFMSALSWWLAVVALCSGKIVAAVEGGLTEKRYKDFHWTSKNICFKPFDLRQLVLLLITTAPHRPRVVSF